ncbi:MAG: hypothetical protein DRP78_00690 [Candidatus Omnitrophota bacterium]|nr:MAG: hypothetical protein DRP78_00690 [Candidatus Omnitrophota bacterium]
MKFVYKAKRDLDGLLDGSIEANSEREALNILSEKGLFPVSIESETDSHNLKLIFQQRIFPTRVNAKQVVIFSQKLKILIYAQVDLLQALKIIYEQTEHNAFQKIILGLHTDVKKGKTFSMALSCFPSVFSSLFVNIVKSGEVSGKLALSLEQINAYLVKQESLRRKVVAALAYPTLLLGVGFISFFVLINFVIPRIGSVFQGVGKDLPFITKSILLLSEFSRKNFWVWLILGIVIFFVFNSRKGADAFKLFLSTFKRKLPIVKRLVKSQELAQFSLSLCLLLKSGISVLKSLEIATPNIEDVKLKQELKDMWGKISSGQSFSKSITLVSGMPDFFIKMIAIGEASGRLAEILEEISLAYGQQVESDIALISSLLEPLLILFIGGVLGIIVVAILLPTFQITELVH